MTILPEIDHFLAHIKSPLRAPKKDFLTCRLENNRRLQSGGCIRTLFYSIVLIENDAFEFSLNNATGIISRPCTLLFVSPFHLIHFKQRAVAKGQCFHFTEAFLRDAYKNSDFYSDFPFFWENDSFYFIPGNAAAPLLELGRKIIAGSGLEDPYASSILAD